MPSAENARRADLVVTSGLLNTLPPIELEGVIAHELAHVKRGDNGVSCVAITLGGDLRRREACCAAAWGRAGSIERTSWPRRPCATRAACWARCVVMEAAPPPAGSFFASQSRFGATRWVWIDPSVGHRDDPVEPGDLDATSVRAAALSEW